jgi:superfamily II DNA or RNA helicase
MISVGLDVPRLNHMYVMGQPKSTSEYIQATSRVGRENPGIVTVLLNGLNPRDLSNYERFINNHEKIYQYVESASVTPFSVPSVHRSLHGTLVAMLRNTSPELSEDEGVKFLGLHAPEFRAARKYLLERAKAVDVSHMNYEQNVLDYLESFTDYWQKLVMNHENVKYSGASDEYEYLFQGDYEAQYSMRDVEAETHLKRRFSN